MFARNKKQQQRIAIIIAGVMLGGIVIGAVAPFFF